MGFFNQLLLLLWKNFTLRKRQKLRLVAEIIFPLALFLILVIVRTTKPDLRVFHPECHFDGKALPSAGVLPFIQTFACTYNNTCYEEVTQDERQDSVQTFNQSILTELVTDLEEILSNNVDVEVISDVLEDLNILADIWPKIRDGNTTGNITLGGDNIINPTELRDRIVSQNLLTSDVVDWLVNATLSRRLLTDGHNETSLLSVIGSFMPTNYATMSGDDLAQYVRAEICDKTRLDEIFWFPNTTVSNNVHRELCNLTTDQLIELGNDYVDLFDWPVFLESFSKFVYENSGNGKALNFGDRGRLEHMVETGAKLYADIQNSSSWQKAFRDTVALFEQLQSEGFGQNSSSAGRSVMASMSLLVCGRGNSFLALPADTSSMQNTRTRVNPNMDTTRHTPSEPGQQDEGTAACKFPNLTSQCVSFFDSFNASEGTRILWRQLKPFVLGMLLYYPKNNVTEKLIKDANQIFVDIKNIITLSADWMNTSSSLTDALNNSRLANFARVLVDNPLCLVAEDRVRRQLSNTTNFNLEGSVCKRLASFLNNGPDTSGFDWRDVMENLNQVFGAIYDYGKCFNFDKFCGYTDHDQMIKDGVYMIKQDMLWAAIEFEINMNDPSLPPHVTYKIRMDIDKVDSTKKVKDKYYRYGPRRQLWKMKYFTSGFWHIQDMVEHAIIKAHTGIGGEKPRVGIFTQQFPYPCYVQDRFIYAISRMFPLFMILAWLLTTAMLCKSIVYEKERRLKEVMKIMGLGNGVHWVAWFINAFVMMFATILLLILLLKAGQVLQYSDPSVILFFMTVFAMATIVKCFLISVFFSRPNLAACCAGFIYFMLYLPYMLLIQWDDLLTLSHKLIVSLSSNVAFGYGCNFIALFEEQAVGIQWYNLLESPITDDEMNMMHCIMMMMIDTVIYAILTWYIEAVFPGQYGIPKPLWFPFMKSYWCGNMNMATDGNNPNHGSMELNGHESDNIEAEPRGRKVGVAIRNLKKIYSTGQTAVDGLTINFFEDQITSFLGHNGAGKTTTMSILTGLFPPTEGTAYVHGEDIRYRIDDIRHSLGMCPQHNVLFDWLTVEEHLWFYARLKGATSKEVKAEMEKMIKDVGLPNKREEMSVNLSGGMKRKLSVAIAFVGNSKTVILDEPTAGVDPYARRAIWQLLLKLKKGRTIILSTHHMDEADVLGDRIAIISHGKLCCVGSSLFLKNRYGNGYYLTLVRSDVDVDEEDILKKQLLEMETPSRPMSAVSVRTLVDVQPTVNEAEDEGYAEKSDSDPPTPPPEDGSVLDFSVKKVTAFIKKYVRNARLVEDNMTEICYQLPDEAAKQGDFEKLFSELERSHRNLGVSSFGISDTSLEEVFLRVANESQMDEMSDESKRNKLEEISDGGRFPRSVTRLSFRRKKKLSLFGKARACRVDSKTDLMADEDTVKALAKFNADSVISGPVSDYGETGFSHSQNDRVTGWQLKLRQFMAIIIKRFHHMRRSKKGFFCEIVLPVVFVLLAMMFALLAPPFSAEPPLELHPWHYVPIKGEPNLYMFFSNDAHESDVTKNFESVLQSRAGVGNRCSKKGVNGYPCEPVGPQTWSPYIYHNTTVDCNCNDGWQHCPAGAGGPTPSQIKLPTTDILYNMTERNISDWLVKTIRQYSKRRYGGLTFGEIDTTAMVRNLSQAQDALERILTAANNGTPISLGEQAFWEDLANVLPRLVTRDVAKVWYNNKGWAASVSYINVMNNLILRSNLPHPENPSDYGITAINHPMEMTKEQLNDEALYASFRDVVIAICVIFAMSFIPASFTMYLIEERTSNSKHLQFVSGINPLIYWFSNFAWDMMNYIIPSVLCIFIFLAFNKAAYVSPTNGPCLVALLFLYGWAMIPMMYPFSRLFSVPSTALVSLNSINVFLGTTSTLATFIIEFLQDDDPELKDINNILMQVFLLMPQYCLGRGLFDMAKNQLFADVYERFGEGNKLPNPFGWKQVGRNLFSMFMLGILFFIINLLIEYGFFIKSRVLKPTGDPLDDEDEDVARERQRVMSGGASDDVLRIQELTKVYNARGTGGRLTSVDRICVGVPRGQCFGLLGVNGAGKTTTFKMLTGDETLTKGNAYVNGHSILNEMVKVQQNIGYCPQFDALDALLTGVEHLRFYARIRGIPEKEVKQVADWAIRRLGLIPHADKISTNYSGGNKRKLSTAISLIGNPPIIFLDEPTTGMDPGARRFLWDCINNIVKDGRSVILTSHSMEECEALCGRLAIMVNGRFKCMGSIQHLKNRFGDGYTVIIRVSGEFPDMEPVIQYINSHFPNSVLKEKHHNMLQYQLGSDIKLSALFGQIEAVRDSLNIEDYSVSQTTLDQVFINFAKQQTDLAVDELDELPEDLAYLDRGYKGPAILLEEQSISGSTVGLLRNDSIRTNNTHVPPAPMEEEDYQASGEPAQPVIPKSDMSSTDDAPIICLPAMKVVGGEGDGAYSIDDETENIARKRPRPLAKFDQFPSIPDPEI